MLNVVIFIVMLSASVLNVIILSVIILKVVILSIIMMNFIMLSDAERSLVVQSLYANETAQDKRHLTVNVCPISSHNPYPALSPLRRFLKLKIIYF
jgi:hypothetical protein